MKIVLPGGAGLVGQNLIARLLEQDQHEIVVLDKHPENLAILRGLQPTIVAESADLASPGDWQRHFEGADAVVMLQAQIGGLHWDDFARNNVESTHRVLDAMRRHGVARLVHISSSVVRSVADDFYSRSKREQERVVLASGLPCVILRPTLMFGWFDRKHLGWLSRFMRKAPLFPIPGHGRYLRQPLYVGDFCRIIASCLQRPSLQGTFDISGHERIDYIDIIREIKRATGSRTPIVTIPYGLFHAALWAWALVDRNPPFTTQQLAALVARDEFDVIDWPALFGVQATPFRQAIDETFTDARYSRVTLAF